MGKPARFEPNTSIVDTLRASYQARLASADALEAGIARAQLERLDGGQRARIRAKAREASGVKSEVSIRPWRRVLLPLLTASGNAPVRWRSTHVFECAHQPYHSSKSGSPVLVDLVIGSYWCRSCGERGGAAEWLMHWRGMSIQSARRLLELRYGSGAPTPADLDETHG